MKIQHLCLIIQDKPDFKLNEMPKNLCIVLNLSLEREDGEGNLNFIISLQKNLNSFKYRFPNIMDKSKNTFKHHNRGGALETEL